MDLETKTERNCSAQLSGMDVVNVWDVGIECFRGREKFHARFYLGNIFKVEESKVAELKGKIDAIAVFLCCIFGIKRVRLGLRRSWLSL